MFWGGRYRPSCTFERNGSNSRLISHTGHSKTINFRPDGAKTLNVSALNVRPENCQSCQLREPSSLATNSGETCVRTTHQNASLIAFGLRPIPVQERRRSQSTDPFRFHPPPTPGLRIEIRHRLARFSKTQASPFITDGKRNSAGFNQFSVF
jgi:hypothetical protein